MDGIALGLRLLSLLGALTIVSVFSADTVLWLFIFMGQAHFVLAYWYKFGRIKDWWRSTFFWLWVGITVCLLGLGVLEAFSLAFWVAVAGSLFVVHHIVDDLTLALGRARWFLVGGLFSGMLVLFGIELAEFVFGMVPEFALLPYLALGTIALSVYIARCTSDLNRYGRLYVVAIALLSALLIVVSAGLSIAQLLGVIILLHYILWYLEYLRKLWGRGRLLRTYLIRVIGVNAVMALIWYSAIRGYELPGYEYFFSETFFFIWTTIHIIFSFIPATISFSKN